MIYGSYSLKLHNPSCYFREAKLYIFFSNERGDKKRDKRLTENRPLSGAFPNFPIRAHCNRKKISGKFADDSIGAQFGYSDDERASIGHTVLPGMI